MWTTSGSAPWVSGACVAGAGYALEVVAQLLHVLTPVLEDRPADVHRDGLDPELPLTVVPVGEPRGEAHRDGLGRGHHRRRPLDGHAVGRRPATQVLERL